MTRERVERSALADEVDQAANLVTIGGALIALAAVWQLFQPWWDPASDAFVAVPALYAMAVAGAVVTAFLLRVRIQVVDDDRLRWIIAGLVIAGTAATFQGIEVADLARVPELATPSGAAALSWIWHGALALFALGGALVPSHHRLRRALIAAMTALLCVALYEPAWEVLPPIVDATGALTSLHRIATAALVALTVAGVVAWLVVRGRRATRPDAWVAIMLMLGGLQLLDGFGARWWFESVWWTTITLRAAQFVIPAAGLLVDNARLVGLLQRHERGLKEQLDRETELAVQSVGHAPPAAGAEARIAAVLVDEAFATVFQPIVWLRSGQTWAVEALTRFSAEPRRTPDVWFDEAHAVGRGVDLELATLRRALTSARGIRDSMAVAVNLSPAALLDPRLPACLDELDDPHPLIVEVTEHAPIADYAQLDDVLVALRRRGVRIAIDDAGAGFASLRHVVRLGPDIIKLDMSLTRGVHEDPVRRALAASLAEFARRTSTILIAEGVEEHAEMEVLDRLGFDGVQGYLLQRPVTAADLKLGTPVEGTEVAPL